MRPLRTARLALATLGFAFALPAQTPAAPRQDRMSTREPGVGDGLTGAWVGGFGREPALARYTMHTTCRGTPAYWYIEQRGDSVKSYTIPESLNRGVKATMPPPPVIARGRIRGRDIVMSDGTNRYRLRYDARSGHLRGTLNGKRFWAVPQEIEREEGCGTVR